jgi:biotin carboxyl carrier protein
LGFENAQAGKVAELKAPMPGLVLKILVEQDQVVSKGENLLILEAMKMENMIKSPADGIIKRLLVTTGDKIEKNTVLIEFN